MRRLPIYFLIDVSESMVGEPIKQVEEGLSKIIQILKTDPQSIETVWISIIVFAGQPKTIVPLQEIVQFYPPKFPIGAGTSLSNGLGHLMFELKRNLVKTTAEQKGDWKPIVFLFTDGVPTDDTTAAIAEWKRNWARTANMVAVSFGEETDVHLLSQLTPNLLHFKNSDNDSYKQFFRWVTDSIKTSSESVENNGTGFELAEIDNDAVTKLDIAEYTLPKANIDSNFAVLTGKCQNSKRPYVMKYKRNLAENPFHELGKGVAHYRLEGAFQLDDSYFELSDETATDVKVNTSELLGAPTCPCCGNQFAFAVCQCGKIHCIGNETESTCPWCGNRGSYSSGDGSGFDVNRAQG